LAVTDVLRRLDALDPLVEAEIPELLADVRPESARSWLRRYCLSHYT